MAILPRSLCIMVTLWMVCSRPSASTGEGSSVPGSQYDAKQLSDILHAAKRLRLAGDLSGLEPLYRKALELARTQNNHPVEIKGLIDLGNIHLLSYHYPLAISEYLQAQRIAQAQGDWANLGLISFNLSSLYQQMGDSDAALASAEEGRAAVARSGPTPYQAQLLLILGRLYASRNDPQAEDLFLEGIEAARRGGDIPEEAQGWDLLGEFRLARGSLAAAERALLEAFRLRTLHDPADLRFSYRRLGALRLAAAQKLPNEPNRIAGLQEAMLLTQKGLASNQDTGSILGSWQLLHQMGQIQEAQGKLDEAIRSYGSAVDQAAAWWGTLSAADSSLTVANTLLHRDVFNSFVEAAAGQSLRTGDPRLAAQSFLAEEFNRALSLRENQALAPAWRSKLPPAYWETLNQLRLQDASELRGEGDPATTQRLRLKISEMETLAGIGFSLSKNENFRSVASLNHFQKGLKESELLLSFHLGARQSYLWAVTRETLRLYRLEASDRIGGLAREFRDAVRGNAPEPELERFGSELYESLFGQLSEEEVGRPSWLVAQEGPLFEVPFAALVRSRGERNSRVGSAIGMRLKWGKSEYLVERTSVQVIPGALLLRSASGAPGVSGRMVAVGDPIYNVADSRYPGSRFQPALWFHSYNAGQLNRLVETGYEVVASAKAWTDAGGSNQALVLTGTASGRRQFLAALQPVPAVIHLATHVLSAPQRQDRAFVAFSLDSTRQPELLATSDIARLQVPGSLVVMSGCSTAAGESREGAGLLGLTRAWLMAGASGTIATAWPVEDSAGELIPTFYRYSRASSTAEALRRSQIDMLRAGGWRSAPSYWAAYQLTGGVR